MWYPDKYTCNINLSGRRRKGECKQAKILLSSLFLFLWMEWMKLVNLPRIVVYLIGLRFKKEGGDNTHFMWVSMSVEKEEASFSAHPSVQFNYLCLGCWSGYLVCMNECFFLTKQRRMIRCLLFTLSIW